MPRLKSCLHNDESLKEIDCLEHIFVEVTDRIKEENKDVGEDAVLLYKAKFLESIGFIDDAFNSFFDIDDTYAKAWCKFEGIKKFDSLEAFQTWQKIKEKEEENGNQNRKK